MMRAPVTRAMSSARFFYVGVGEEFEGAAAIGTMALRAVVEKDWGDVFGEGDWASDLNGLFFGWMLNAVANFFHGDESHGGETHHDKQRNPKPGNACRSRRRCFVFAGGTM